MPTKKWQAAITSISFAPHEFGPLDRDQQLMLGTSESPFAVLPFINRPLIRLGAHFFLISRDLIVRRATDGIFWDLHSAFAEEDPDEGVRRFMFTFGRRVQVYMESIFKRMYPSVGGTADRLVLLDGIEINSRGRRLADACILEPPFVAVIEITSSRFSARGIMGSDPKSFHRDVERMILDKVEQLDHTIEMIADQTIDLGIQSDKPLRFIPILATLDGFPAVDRLRYPLDHLIQQRGLLTGPGIEPLEIIDADEWEGLEPIVTSGDSLCQIIQAKNRSGGPGWKPIRDYLYEQGIGDEMSPALQQSFDELGGLLGPTLFAHSA